MAETNGDTLFYFSEYAVNLALLELIAPDEPAEATGTLMDETAEVVCWFNQTVQGIMIEIASQHLQEDDGTIPFEEICIGDVLMAEDLEIPFFFETRLRITSHTAPPYEYFLYGNNCHYLPY